MKKKNYSRIITTHEIGKSRKIPVGSKGYAQVVADDAKGKNVARLTMDFDLYRSLHYCDLHEYKEIDPLNPYLDAFNEEQERVTKVVSGSSIDSLLARSNYEIVDGRTTNIRAELCRKFAWSVPTEGFALAIQKHTNQKLVDIGAGTGYWAWFLKQYGINSVCYDLNPYNNHHAKNKWYEISIGGPEKVLDHQDRTLALFWPMYNTSQAYDSLMNYEGDTLVYVGEGYYGCTGDNAFHEELESNWELVYQNYCDYQWNSIHSEDNIWKRIKT